MNIAVLIYLLVDWVVWVIRWSQFSLLDNTLGIVK